VSTAIAPTILVVDDEPANLRLMSALLSAEGYRSITARGAAEAFERILETVPDLILLDINMPGMDGFEAAQRLKGDSSTSRIPIIMVTALDDRESRLKALERGAEEFLTKPIDRAELRVRVRNLLRLKEYQDFLASHNRLLENQVAERTVALRNAYHETIQTLVRAAEYKDSGTGAHVRRISHYCRHLAEELGMERGFCEQIFHASPMHDIGKIGIPDAVLTKPGGFDANEACIMRTHPMLGAEILASGQSPYTVMGAEIALNHHEAWNGSGYPAGKRGEEIPLAARIMNIADQYDALRSLRPYKPALSHKTAVEILEKGDHRTRPEHFDPALLSAAIRSSSHWDEIFESHRDEETIEA
jgi:putative two-component system response regulator